MGPHEGSKLLFLRQEGQLEIFYVACVGPKVEFELFSASSSGQSSW